ncbi:NAD(P)-dependent oxidoreductase [Crocosphaera sp.]|uniref:NAD(P)-dependent oxidoreductase n=1 Tax=Crocosphaera sp. TaxID=2729996 RepID=UPI003F1E6F67|nr:NAD(P)-dependent oxidoreductase [Crocosphaera sp.]
MKVAIIREEKNPPDSRVPLTPEQCQYLMQTDQNLEIVIQASEKRCFSDLEYQKRGISVVNNISNCDILLGVKEVPIAALIPEKTYLFFSHTHKEQPYNRKLLQTILKKKIRLIDYECLCDNQGKRVIAFGHWAGVVGAHNAILAWGKRQQTFALKPMHQCYDFAEAKTYYENLSLPNFKIVITGDGRVSNGAATVLDLMNIKQVAPQDFVTQQFSSPVYTKLSVQDMYYKKGEDIFNESDYYKHPEQYSSSFEPYTKVSDIMINGIYWEKGVPVFFTKEDMKKDDFKIKVIADVTCDIAPDASIPCTVRPSTIAEPIYGYEPYLERESQPFQPQTIDIMAVDNLPNELPRDASEDFGKQLIDRVWDELNKTDSQMIYHGTIALNGQLNEPYEYLHDFVDF